MNYFEYLSHIIIKFVGTLLLSTAERWTINK